MSTPSFSSASSSTGTSLAALRKAYRDLSEHRKDPARPFRESVDLLVTLCQDIAENGNTGLPFSVDPPSSPSSLQSPSNKKGNATTAASFDVYEVTSTLDEALVLFDESLAREKMDEHLTVSATTTTTTTNAAAAESGGTPSAKVSPCCFAWSSHTRQIALLFKETLSSLQSYQVHLDETLLPDIDRLLEFVNVTLPNAVKEQLYKVLPTATNGDADNDPAELGEFQMKVQLVHERFDQWLANHQQGTPATAIPTSSGSTAGAPIEPATDNDIALAATREGQDTAAENSLHGQLYRLFEERNGDAMRATNDVKGHTVQLLRDTADLLDNTNNHSASNSGVENGDMVSALQCLLYHMRQETDPMINGALCDFYYEAAVLLLTTCRKLSLRFRQEQQFFQELRAMVQSHFERLNRDRRDLMTAARWLVGEEDGTGTNTGSVVEPFECLAQEMRSISSSLDQCVNNNNDTAEDDDECKISGLLAQLFQRWDQLRGLVQLSSGSGGVGAERYADLMADAVGILLWSDDPPMTATVLFSHWIVTALLRGLRLRHDSSEVVPPPAQDIFPFEQLQQLIRLVPWYHRASEARRNQEPGWRNEDQWLSFDERGLILYHYCQPPTEAPQAQEEEECFLQNENHPQQQQQEDEEERNANPLYQQDHQPQHQQDQQQHQHESSLGGESFLPPGRAVSEPLTQWMERQQTLPTQSIIHQRRSLLVTLVTSLMEQPASSTGSMGAEGNMGDPLLWLSTPDSILVFSEAEPTGADGAAKVLGVQLLPGSSQNSVHTTATAPLPANDEAYDRVVGSKCSRSASNGDGGSVNHSPFVADPEAVLLSRLGLIVQYVAIHASPCLSAEATLAEALIGCGLQSNSGPCEDNREGRDDHPGMCRKKKRPSLGSVLRYLSALLGEHESGSCGPATTGSGSGGPDYQRHQQHSHIAAEGRTTEASPVPRMCAVVAPLGTTTCTTGGLGVAGDPLETVSMDLLQYRNPTSSPLSAPAAPAPPLAPTATTTSVYVYPPSYHNAEVEQSNTMVSITPPPRQAGYLYGGPTNQQPCISMGSTGSLPHRSQAPLPIHGQEQGQWEEAPSASFPQTSLMALAQERPPVQAEEEGLAEGFSPVPAIPKSPSSLAMLPPSRSSNNNHQRTRRFGTPVPVSAQRQSPPPQQQHDARSPSFGGMVRFQTSLSFESPSHCGLEGQNGKENDTPVPQQKSSMTQQQQSGSDCRKKKGLSLSSSTSRGLCRPVGNNLTNENSSTGSAGTLVLLPNMVKDGQHLYSRFAHALSRLIHCPELQSHRLRVVGVRQVQHPVLDHAYHSKLMELRMKHKPHLQQMSQIPSQLRSPTVSTGGADIYDCPHLVGNTFASEVPELFDPYYASESAVPTRGSLPQGQTGANNMHNTGKPPENNLWLLHGTPHSVAETIVEHGFDERVSNVSGLFGAGIYFTNTLCKAHKYAKPKVERGAQFTEHSVLLCSVALGHSYITDKKIPSLRRPPSPAAGTQGASSSSCNDNTSSNSRNGGSSMMTVPNSSSIGSGNIPFDSVIGNGKQHKEFVVYDRSMVYPSYWITYTVDTNSL